MKVEITEPIIYAKDLKEWRSWLEKHGKIEKYVFLVVYNKKSKMESVGWYESIEHALCFGWVDSIAKKRDEESCFIKFTPRNPKSNWGKKNVERAKKLIEQGMMRDEGMKLIEIARKNGKWNDI